MYLDADLNKISQKMKKRKYLIRTTGKGLQGLLKTYQNYFSLKL